jgi:hypothetical protein
MSQSRIYIVQSSKGYWLADGRGYTQDIDQAGHFKFADLVMFNLDKCTLHLLRDLP